MAISSHGDQGAIHQEIIRTMRSSDARVHASKTAGHRTQEEVVDWKEYPSIPSGEYAAYCAWGRKYRDPAFRRWTCLLRFDVFRDGFTEVIARLPMWLSLGNGERPRASRRGKYLQEWVRANGSPPVRADRLSTKVFVHRICQVEIGDTLHGPVPYSIVKKILAWDTGGNSRNSVSNVTQSRGKGTKKRDINDLPQTLARRGASPP
jgi:hypothetical protein